MNGPEYKKYRQCGSGAGGALSTTNTKAKKIAQMKALGSAFVEYCVSPFKRFDYVNNCMPVADFDAMYLYPLIAGLRYSNSIGMSVVFKYLNILSTPDISLRDQKDYAAAGGTIVQKTKNVLDGNTNFEIKVNNTCYQGSQVTLTNPAVVYEENVFTKYFIDNIIEKIRGMREVANSVSMEMIKNYIVTDLLPVDCRDSKKWITDYTDEVTGVTQKAFDKITFSQEGDVFYITGTFTMSVTPNFVFILSTFITPGQTV
jgi:hypothetical protein